MAQTKRLFTLILLWMLGSTIPAMAGGTYHMKVGDTKIVSFSTNRDIKSVAWTSSRPDDVVITSSNTTSTSATIKAVKSFTGKAAVIHCEYKYYLTSGTFTYVASSYEDFNIYVDPVTPISIYIPRNLTLALGKSSTLTPTLTPSDAETTLTWSSSNTAVATVNQSGEVYAKGAGTATITVTTDNNKRATCEVAVPAAAPAGISIESSLTLDLGKSVILTPTITPPDAKTTLTWSSNNTVVATVNQSGEVYAKGAGTATITVTTDNNMTATCEVTVPAASPTGISIESSMTLDLGKSATLTPTITPPDAKTTLTWSSSNTVVATVNESGEVYARGAGTAIITVKTDNNLSATCQVNVPESSFTWNETVPANNEQNVSLNTPISVNFSVPIFQGSQYSNIILFNEKLEVLVSGSLSINGNKLIFVPSQALEPNTDYKFTVPIGAVKNQAEVSNASVVEIKFKTFVPTETYSLKCLINGEGSVLYDGEALTSSEILSLEEKENVKLQIKPNDGFQISQITWNGEDVTSELDADNYYTTPAITSNSTLNIVFEAIDTGIETIAVTNKIKVFSMNGILTVLNAPVGEHVDVYNASGYLITAVISKGEVTAIHLSPHAIYFIKVGDRSFKVQL